MTNYLSNSAARSILTSIDCTNKRKPFVETMQRLQDGTNSYKLAGTQGEWGSFLCNQLLRQLLCELGRTTVMTPCVCTRGLDNAALLIDDMARFCEVNNIAVKTNKRDMTIRLLSDKEIGL